MLQPVVPGWFRSFPYPDLLSSRAVGVFYRDFVGILLPLFAALPRGCIMLLAGDFWSPKPLLLAGRQGLHPWEGWGCKRMLLEHPPGWRLAQHIYIQQVWRRAEGRDIVPAGHRLVLGFALSMVKFTPNAGVSVPTPGLSNLPLSPQAQTQSLSPLAFLRSFLRRGLKFWGDLVSIPSCRSRGWCNTSGHGRAVTLIFHTRPQRSSVPLQSPAPFALVLAGDSSLNLPSPFFFHSHHTLSFPPASHGHVSTPQGFCAKKKASEECNRDEERCDFFFLGYIHGEDAEDQRKEQILQTVHFFTIIHVLAIHSLSLKGHRDGFSPSRSSRVPVKHTNHTAHLFQALGQMGFQNSKGTLSELQNKTKNPTDARKALKSHFSRWSWKWLTFSAWWHFRFSTYFWKEDALHTRCLCSSSC